MADTGFQYDNKWREGHTVLDQSTNRGQKYSVYDSAIDTTPPYIIDILTQRPSEGNSDRCTHWSYLPDSIMTAQEHLEFSHPAMSREAGPSTDMFSDAAPLEGTNIFPGKAHNNIRTIFLSGKDLSERNNRSNLLLGVRRDLALCSIRPLIRISCSHLSPVLATVSTGPLTIWRIR
jgi:hypothetical protein